MHEQLGGRDKDKDLLERATCERWQLARVDLRNILRNEELWVKQCLARGVSEGGMLRSEAQLPQFLRKHRRGRGEVVRAKGGGRKGVLQFLYPCVEGF